MPVCSALQSPICFTEDTSARSGTWRDVGSPVVLFWGTNDVDQGRMLIMLPYRKNLTFNIYKTYTWSHYQSIQMLSSPGCRLVDWDYDFWRPRKHPPALKSTGWWNRHLRYSWSEPSKKMSGHVGFYGYMYIYVKINNIYIYTVCIYIQFYGYIHPFFCCATTMGGRLCFISSVVFFLPRSQPNLEVTPTSLREALRVALTSPKVGSCPMRHVAVPNFYGYKKISPPNSETTMSCTSKYTC